MKLYIKDSYQSRHIGPQIKDQKLMLRTCGIETIKELIDQTIPEHIRIPYQLKLPSAKAEQEALRDFKIKMEKNKLFRCHLGMGYYPSITPSVILRCLIENPSWYTPYTPYQAEISQGRLEMLLNFQTMISDLTGMDISNASLLDEGLAAAEAVNMCVDIRKGRNTLLIHENVLPQTISIVQTRMEPLGVNVHVVSDVETALKKNVCAVLFQNPGTDGQISDLSDVNENVHKNGAKVIVATDLLACTIIKSPGEMKADIVIGTNQRFGIPMGFGGPHAGFLACKNQFKRKMPGRLVGVSITTKGTKAYRLALQTREQHIRRDKATSNICTAQALLANISASYAIYHGPKGLSLIAQCIHNYTLSLAEGLKKMGLSILNEHFFDTILVEVPNALNVIKVGIQHKINIRKIKDTTVSISLDETTRPEHLKDLFEIFSISCNLIMPSTIPNSKKSPIKEFSRQTDFLTHPVFNKYQSETAMMRYLYQLEKRDLGLNTAAIPLGSCTMKLNAASCLIPITWPKVNNIHPFVPAQQREGYTEMIEEISRYLAEITGFHSISLQPNSGSQGEYTGLMVIAAYHRSNGDHNRNICLIPTSAHGTNPASAAFAGMQVKVVKCDINGNVSLEDMKTKAEEYKNNLSCCMLTYPSTHGVFEEDIMDIMQVVHYNGGQVYMDGANLQALVGYCTPVSIGADVCHLNLHKTFCIPHGGGGPGLGPIGVREHLSSFLPNHPVIKDCGGTKSFGTVAAAPWSSASILPIPYMYISMMGSDGLERATEQSILNANYMMTRLKDDYEILYKGSKGRCAHEFIVDLRMFKKFGVTEEDVAKRLMDFNFHAPTMSWPVPGTLMIEPTESEPKDELDRMIDAFKQIRREIQEVVDGKIFILESPLHNAPHTTEICTDPNWNRLYTQHQAAFALSYLRKNKLWPYVSRINNVYGDKNVHCTCPSLSIYES